MKLRRWEIAELIGPACTKPKVGLSLQKEALCAFDSLMPCMEESEPMSKGEEEY